MHTRHGHRRIPSDSSSDDDDGDGAENMVDEAKEIGEEDIENTC